MLDNKDFYVRLGELLKEGRESKLKITQEEFADRVGLSRPSIANIERGRQQITVFQLVKFAGIIGVRPEDLIPRSEDNRDKSLSDMLPDSASHFKDWVNQLQGT